VKIVKVKIWFFVLFTAFLLGLIFFGPKFFVASLSAPTDEIAPQQAVDLEDDPPLVEAVIESSLSLEDQLDEIAEKLDIIQQQVNEMVAKQAAASESEASLALSEREEDKEEQEKKLDEEKKENEPKDEKMGEQKLVFAQILISDAQSAIENRFIKLYNPTEFSIDLTGWYLQRKTQGADSWGSLVSSTKFQNKIIMPNSYFLISRTNALADIFLEDLTITENNSLALKNPNGEVSSEFLTLPLPAPPVTSGGGSSEPVFVYPKILISEVQLNPIEQRFIELYNPTENNVSLTGWYLQRKTETSESWNSSVSSTKFEGKTISAKGFFLISRTELKADILLESLTLTKNNSFVIKNPNREISDELSLKASGNPETGKSLCRKSNTLEFVICSLTPKAENQEWIDLPANDSGDYFLDSGDYH